jgi:hypothetical protein
VVYLCCFRPRQPAYQSLSRCFDHRNQWKKRRLQFDLSARKFSNSVDRPRRSNTAALGSPLIVLVCWRRLFILFSLFLPGLHLIGCSLAGVESFLLLCALADHLSSPFSIIDRAAIGPNSVLLCLRSALIRTLYLRPSPQLGH